MQKKTKKKLLLRENSGSGQLELSWLQFIPYETSVHFSEHSGSRICFSTADPYSHCARNTHSFCHNTAHTQKKV